MRFLSARVTVTRLRGSTGTDDYGNPILDWDNPDQLDIALCQIDPIPGTDTFDADGKRVLARWNLDAPTGSDITDDDRISHGGNVYDIDGTVRHQPSPTGRLDHLEMVLKRLEAKR